MRKIILLAFAILLLLFIGFYFLIPNQINITRTISIHAAQNAVLRCFAEKHKWEKWWPHQNDLLKYPEDNFSLEQKLLSRILIEVREGNSYLPTFITIASLKIDSCLAIWQYTMPATSNPFKKTANYFKAKNIKQRFDNVLTALRAFAENEENVYGMKIQLVKVKDSSLVVAESEAGSYPGTTAIYKLINELKQYINSSGASETDYPMMHIQKLKNNKYQLMIAVPVNRPLKGNARIEPKRMVLGNILMAEVKGGSETVKKAIMEMENYVYDYRQTAPAIPFQMLVTDRSKQTDSSQWITRIYYPVL